jgi:hypothetical protein
MSAADAIELQKWVGSDAPVAPWPYGMPTVVNPWIVVLGASPGNSPDHGETVTHGSYKLPTVASAHPEFAYRDTRGFWDKTRSLTRTALAANGVDSTADADALAGIMNLDDRRSGNAADVPYRREMAHWAVRTSLQRLQPRYIVALGLSSGEPNRVLRDALEGALGAPLPSTPDREEEFEGYSEKRLKFRTWRLPGTAGEECDLVLWPQHPTRAPFSNSALWEAACRQYFSYKG